MNLECGDIVLYHGTSWSARGIQFLTNSYWNHAAMVTHPQGLNAPVVIEAGPVVRYADLDIKGDIAIYRDPTLTTQNQYDLRSAAKEMTGKPYDFMLAPRVLRKLGLWNSFSLICDLIGGRNPIVPHIEDQFVVCSELVQEIYAIAGLPLLSGNRLLLPGGITKVNRLRLVYGKRWH